MWRAHHEQKKEFIKSVKGFHLAADYYFGLKLDERLKIIIYGV